jgi:hypothetical protein
MERLRRQRDETREELEALAQEQRSLSADLETWKQLERKDLNQRYAQAVKQWEQARAAVPGSGEHPVFGSMTGDEAWAYAQKKQQERENILSENRRRKGERDQAEQTVKARRTQGLILGLAAVCAVFLGVIWMISGPSPIKIGIFALALALVALGAALELRELKKAREALETLTFLEVPEETDELFREAADYRAALTRREQAIALAQAARRRVEDLESQGAQGIQTLELLKTPPRSKGETAQKLGYVSGEISRLQSQLSRAEGALSQMGEPELLEARQAELDGKIAERTAEYDAISEAMDALDQANSQLRERFSPALNREASRIFAELTGGTWSELALSKDFSASISGDGPLPRSALYLSAGTADQLYLAVRLAMCQLTLPDCPILLDDVLANFDDARAEKALSYLKELGSQRQILLFSCHQREADWGGKQGVSVLSL